jgi:hypothetical protein
LPFAVKIRIVAARAITANCSPRLAVVRTASNPKAAARKMISAKEIMMSEIRIAIPAFLS